MLKPVMIDHIVLRTDQYALLIEFYCTVIGCNIERVLAPEVGLTQLRAGGSLIDIVDVSGELGRAGGSVPHRTGNNLDHFCLQIEPVEETALVAYLHSHGVKVGAIEARYGAQGMGRSIYIEDPVGNKVELKNSIL